MAMGGRRGAVQNVEKYVTSLRMASLTLITKM